MVLAFRRVLLMVHSVAVNENLPYGMQSMAMWATDVKDT